MNQFACEVRSGLAKPRKELPSKYLYDELGSALFDAITALPEYGLTRADGRLLQRHAPELPREFSCVAEFGSGSGAQDPRDSFRARARHYFPIDVSAAALDRCLHELAGLAEIEPIEASYLDGLDRSAAQWRGRCWCCFWAARSAISIRAAAMIFCARFARACSPATRC